MKSRKSIEELKTLGEIEYCKPSVHIIGGDAGMCMPGSIFDGCFDGLLNTWIGGCNYGTCNSGDGGCWPGGNNFDEPNVVVDP